MTKKSDDGNGGNYEVGYKKPPKHTQFKKGQSGNRKGRPKGSKNAKQLAHEIANELIMVRDKNGKLIKKTRFGLLLENLTTSGIKLDVPAARLVFNILKTTGYLDEPDKSDTRKSGVLLMPAPMTKEEWIERYAKKPNDEKS
ncbi:MAG: DUF5681 domain-containing protein [Gammaproteobacteria bacterium]